MNFRSAGTKRRGLGGQWRFLLFACMMAIAIVGATHIRYGTMAWSSMGENKQKLNLKFRLAMRRSASWVSNNRVGSRYYSGSVKWGDGKRSRAGPFIVTPGGVDKSLDFSDSVGEIKMFEDIKT